MVEGIIRKQDLYFSPLSFIISLTPVVAEEEFIEEIKPRRKPIPLPQVGGEGNSKELKAQHYRKMEEYELIESVQRQKYIAAQIQEESEKPFPMESRYRTRGTPKKKRIPVIYMSFKPNTRGMHLTMCKIKELERYEGGPEYFHQHQIVPDRYEYW